MPSSPQHHSTFWTFMELLLPQIRSTRFLDGEELTQGHAQHSPSERLVRQPRDQAREESEDDYPERQDTHVGQRARKYVAQRDVGRDALHHVQVQAYGRCDQAHLHVQGHHHAKPYRIKPKLRDDREQDRHGNEDDRHRRDEEPQEQEQQVHDHEDHPPVHLEIGYQLRQLLGNVEEAQHLAEHGGEGDDHQDHRAGPCRFQSYVHEVSQVHRAIQESDQDYGQQSAHARGLAGGGDPEVQDAKDAGDQHGKRDHLGQHAKPVLPGVALLSADDLRGFATFSCAAGPLLETPAPPTREHCYQDPQTEEQRDHDARHDAAQEQAPDRRLRGYSVQDQGDARRYQYAQRTPRDYRPR